MDPTEEKTFRELFDRIASHQRNQTVDKFLEDRRNESNKQYIKLIIEYLEEKRKKGEEWVRARDIHNALVETGEIPHSTTLQRLLSDLTKNHIILRQKESGADNTKGAKPVYYGVPYQYPKEWFMSRDELLELLDLTRLESMKFLLRWGITEKLLLKQALETDESYNVQTEVEKYGREHGGPSYNELMTAKTLKDFQKIIIKNKNELRKLIH